MDIHSEVADAISVLQAQSITDELKLLSTLGSPFEGDFTDLTELVDKHEWKCRPSAASVGPPIRLSLGARRLRRPAGTDPSVKHFAKDVGWIWVLW